MNRTHICRLICISLLLASSAFAAKGRKQIGARLTLPHLNL